MNFNTKKIGAPKLSVAKAINKFVINWDLKIPKVPIYYAWEPKIQPKWINGTPEQPYIGVDYDQYKKEWYISYVINERVIYYGTVDDVTGNTEISSSFDTINSNNKEFVNRYL